MSERTIQDNQDQIVKTTLEELERNRDILTGSKFRKCYQLPWCIFWVIPISISIIALFDPPISPEIQRVVFLPIVLGTAVGGLLFIILGIDNLNRRIDKIIELTGVETKLEEKYYSNVKAITGSYPEKVNS
jgi:hypothetical protein